VSRTPRSPRAPNVSLTERARGFKISCLWANDQIFGALEPEYNRSSTVTYSTVSVLPTPIPTSIFHSSGLSNLNDSDSGIEHADNRRNHRTRRNRGIAGPDVTCPCSQTPFVVVGSPLSSLATPAERAACVSQCQVVQQAPAPTPPLGNHHVLLLPPAPHRHRPPSRTRRQILQNLHLLPELETPRVSQNQVTDDAGDGGKEKWLERWPRGSLHAELLP
jgi:hypothetical protein